MGDAMQSALAEVKRAEPSLRLIEVMPDMVGLGEVADLVGVSRQNMRKLMLAHSSSFPLPIHDGSASLWHLAELLAWLEAKGRYRFEPTLPEVARAAMQVNLARDASRRSKKAAGKLEALVS